MRHRKVALVARQRGTFVVFCAGRRCGVTHIGVGVGEAAEAAEISAVDDELTTVRSILVADGAEYRTAARCAEGVVGAVCCDREWRRNRGTRRAARGVESQRCTAICDRELNRDGLRRRRARAIDCQQTRDDRSGDQFGTDFRVFILVAPLFCGDRGMRPAPSTLRGVQGCSIGAAVRSATASSLGRL